MFQITNVLLQFLATFSVLLAQFITGVHKAWPSVYIPQLLNGTHFQITPDEGSWIASLLQVGGFFGTLLPPLLANRIGRKRLVLLTSIPFLICPLILAFTSTVLSTYIARFIVGVAIGVSYSLTPVYLGEIAHPKIRGVITNCMYIFIVGGVIFINVAGSYLSIRDSSFVSIVLTITFFGTFVWMPESPYYFIMSRKYDKGKQSLQKLRSSTTVDEEFDRIKKAVEEEQKRETFLKLIKMKSTKRAFLIMLIVLNGRLLSGDGPFLSYAQTICQTVTDTLPPSLIVLMFYLARLFVSFLNSFFVERFGRKLLLLLSFFGTFLSILFLSIFLYVRLRTSIELSAAVKNLAVGLLVLLSFFSTFSSSVSLVTLGEIFSPKIRTYGSLFYGAYYFLVESLEAKFFQIASDSLGMDVTFFFYSVCCFVHGILVWIFVFETKGKTLEEIQEKLGR